MKTLILEKIKEVARRTPRQPAIGVDSLMLMFKIKEPALKWYLEELEKEGQISFVPPSTKNRGKALHLVIFTGDSAMGLYLPVIPKAGAKPAAYRLLYGPNTRKHIWFRP